MIDLDKQKAALLAEKELLEQQLAEVAVPDKQNPGGYAAKEPDMGDENGSDFNDVADELEEFGNNNAITNDLEIRMKNVVDALEKIENGTYGICEVSGEPIEEDRLEALPSARTNKANME